MMNDNNFEHEQKHQDQESTIEVSELNTDSSLTEFNELSETAELPEINPADEMVLTGRDVLKMILGGYLAFLPAFLAIILTFVIIYLLFGR